MRARLLIGAFLLFTVVGPGVVGTSGHHMAQGRQWAIAYVTEPTLIGEVIVQGPVLFTHDEGKMARGEACTSVRLFEPSTGPAEEIASFHCTPRARPVVQRFTMRTRPNATLGFGCVLMEYQFAGDAEAHGVPTSVNAH